jgi:hypothetical protein
MSTTQTYECILVVKDKRDSLYRTFNTFTFILQKTQSADNNYYSLRLMEIDNLDYLLNKSEKIFVKDGNYDRTFISLNDSCIYLGIQDNFIFKYYSLQDNKLFISKTPEFSFYSKFIYIKVKQIYCNKSIIWRYCGFSGKNNIKLLKLVNDLIPICLELNHNYTKNKLKFFARSISKYNYNYNSIIKVFLIVWDTCVIYSKVFEKK